MPKWLRLRGMGCAILYPATSSERLITAPVNLNVLRTGQPRIIQANAKKGAFSALHPTGWIVLAPLIASANAAMPAVKLGPGSDLSSSGHRIVGYKEMARHPAQLRSAGWLVSNHTSTERLGKVAGLLRHRHPLAAATDLLELAPFRTNNVRCRWPTTGEWRIPTLVDRN